MLFGFDLAPSRIGYNLFDKVYATIDGGLAFAMKSYPLDIKKYSKSSLSRISKYFTNKDIAVMLPSLNNINDSNNLSLIKDKDNNTILNISLDRFNCVTKYYHIDYESSIIGSDYDYEIDHRIIDNILDDKELSFMSSNLRNVIDLPDKFIEQTIKKDVHDFDEFESMNKNEIKYYLGDDYKNFSMCYHVNEDYDNAKKIWKQKIDQYINVAKQKIREATNDKNFLRGWKYLNPESRYFGQIHQNDYQLDNNLSPIQIGLKMDNFQAFMDCRKNIDYINNTPNEIFKLICEYWLKFEVDLAKQRLLELVKVNQQ